MSIVAAPEGLPTGWVKPRYRAMKAMTTEENEVSNPKNPRKRATI
jgi:hypothetical protein